jgi:hypothetical protein
MRLTLERPVVMPVVMLLVLPAVLLCGCDHTGPKTDPARAECERQADSDPKVMDLKVKQFSITPSDPPIGPDIAVARHEALLHCLQAKGLAAPGGVEPLRPRY